MNNVKNNFEKSILFKDIYPIVKIDVNGNNLDFLLDTGSDITIIDNKVYNDVLFDVKILNKKKVIINTLNCEKEMYVNIISTTFDNIPCCCYTMDISDIIENVFTKTGVIIEGIIGSDFMFQNELIIDFGDKKIKNL